MELQPTLRYLRRDSRTFLNADILRSLERLYLQNRSTFGVFVPKVAVYSRIIFYAPPFKLEPVPFRHPSCVEMNFRGCDRGKEGNDEDVDGFSVLDEVATGVCRWTRLDVETLKGRVLAYYSYTLHAFFSEREVFDDRYYFYITVLAWSITTCLSRKGRYYDTQVKKRWVRPFIRTLVCSRSCIKQ